MGIGAHGSISVRVSGWTGNRSQQNRHTSVVSVYIVKRATVKGDRWYVRFDAGLKERRRIKRPDGEKPDRWPTVHLGTFASEKLAKVRVEAAQEEIAQGRMPQQWQGSPVKVERTVAEWAALWLASRLSAADETRRRYERSVRTLPPEIANSDPSALTHADVQAWIVSLTKQPHRRAKTKNTGLSRGTISGEVIVLKLVLDYAGVEHNPARDRRVQLPRAKRQAYRLPTRVEIKRLHEIMPSRVPLLNLLEHTGMRISEAAALRWGDIDHARNRLFVHDSKTAAGVRFVEHLPGTPEWPHRGAHDATERVFSRPSPMTLSNVLAQSHRRHGTADITSHSFRHLHASRLLHDQTLSPAQISARLGHANVAVTLGIYSHVVPPD